jgi:drug/metabolite transporter (DMT)-like permease
MANMTSASKPSLARLVLIYAGLVLVAVVWGNAFVAIRYAVQFITPVELAAVRFLPVVILFGSWLLATDRAGVRQLFREEWRKLLYMALVGITTYHLAVNTGEVRVSAGTASLIIALSPAVAVVLSAIWLRNRITLLQVGGLVVSFAGLIVVVVYGEGVQFNLNEFGSYLLVLLAAVVWGSYSVVGQSIPGHHPRLRVTAVVLTLAGLPLVALAPWDFWPRFVALPLQVWGAVAFLSLLCTVFAYVVWLYGVSALGAARVQSFNYLVPLFAVFSGALLLGERITWGQVAGGVLIVAGVVAINQRKK